MSKKEVNTKGPVVQDDCSVEDYRDRLNQIYEQVKKKTPTRKSDKNKAVSVNCCPNMNSFDDWRLIGEI